MKTFLKKILACFGKIPQDKLLHYIAGMLIYFIMLALFSTFITNEPVRKTLSFIIACVMGIVKEFVVDKKLGGSVEWADSNVTTAGALTGVILSCFI